MQFFRQAFAGTPRRGQLARHLSRGDVGPITVFILALALAALWIAMRPASETFGAFVGQTHWCRIDLAAIYGARIDQHAAMG